METTQNLLPIGARDTVGIIKEILHHLEQGVRPAAILTTFGMNIVSYHEEDGKQYMELPAELPSGCMVKLATGEVGSIQAMRFEINE